MTNSDEFIKRLITYYKTHTEASCLPIWTGTYSHLRELIDKEDIAGLRKTLDELYIDDLWGLDYNQKNSWNLPPYESCFSMCIDTMASELKFYNESNEKTVKILEKLVGARFDIPIYPHRPVIQVGDRNIPLRFAVCYYIFYCLLQNLQETPNRVLEIGAGTGYFPFLFTRKYPDLKYNIIDLPIISVIQTYIFATMVGEDKIWFHGEPLNNEACLRIYSPDVIDDIEGLINVALNHNSFPEIPQDAQEKYLEKMKQLLTPKGIFYSVNWEPHNSDQTPVPVACEKSRLKNVSRRIFPIESLVHQQSSIAFYEEVYKV